MIGSIPKLEELEARIEALERLFSGEEDVNGNEFFRTSIKYIVFTKDEKRVLSYSGFKNVEPMNDYNIRLFKSPSDIKDYIENHRLYRRCEIKIKRIKVTYELIKRGADDEH